MKHYNFFLAALGMLFLFNLSPLSPPAFASDTLSVFGFHEGEPTEFKFPMPSRGEFDTLIRKVAKITWFENRNNDPGDIGKNERKFFLNLLKSWRDKPHQHLNNVLTGCEKKAIFNDEKYFYGRLPELIKISKQGDLCLLQAILIRDHWPMHIAHANGDFIPVWDEEEMDKFYGVKPAKAEKPADSSGDVKQADNWF